jgi:hypothetical protein
VKIAALSSGPLNIDEGLARIARRTSFEDAGMAEGAMELGLEQDTRWLRLHDREWTCPCCGTKHAGLFDLACDAPDFWRDSRDKKPNAEVRSAQQILTEDFCILDGEHFFVRSVLELPIVGSSEHRFGYGVWATLSRKNFDLYVDSFDGGAQGHLGPWFGWFSNRLAGYPDTLNLKCQVHPQDGRKRPYLVLEPTDHPLAVEQREGITFDRILAIYALHGHDLRVALSD